MSSIKEPYIISVWEEELIPPEDWYVKGEETTDLTESQYNELSEQEKEQYYLNENNIYIKKEVRLSAQQYNDFVSTEKNKYSVTANGDYSIGNEIISRDEFLKRIIAATEPYERYSIMEHYEETQGIIVGSDEMESVFGAVNPVFKENVNGSVELTFSIYYKIFDPETGEFSMNPFVSMLTNEAKIKLKFREKWYDLIIKNCQEDSTNYMFTYTCKDFYTNELSKNGFKVELDAELENNQDTVVGLGKTILKDTDWRINEEKSDLIVETKIEPLYLGILKYDIDIEKVNNYTSDPMIDGSDEKDFPKTATIYKKQQVKMEYVVDGVKEEIEEEIDVPVLFFYSDIAERKKEPQIFAVFKNGEYKIPADERYYTLDANEDILTSGCNYRIVSYTDPSDNSKRKVEYSNSALKDNLINIVQVGGLTIYERGRAEKVIRSQKTGYDPDMDRFIAKYYKKKTSGEPDKSIEYYGYSKEEILRTGITENYLANSDDFTSTNTGWVFDGVPEKRLKNEETGYVGQIFQRTAINEANPSSGQLFEESVLELSLKSANDMIHYYKDVKGKYYRIFEENEFKILEEKFYEVTSEKGQLYEKNIMDLYKKYQREGTSGYAERTDDEIDIMVSDYLKSNRYSIGYRAAINTGVAANRNKIKQLSPGEEYIFAVSLGKFKEGEEPLEMYKDNITYGVTAPDAYYQFLDVDDEDGQLSYAAANKAIDEYRALFEANNMKYYQENTTYAGEYQKVYNDTYNTLKDKYKKRYLRTSTLSNNQTIKNWQPGGRRKSGLLSLWGEYIGYYQIFLNVLRGTGEDSKEICCDEDFIPTLSKRLAQISTNTGNDAISQQVYYALVDKDILEKPDAEGEMQPYFQGLYPEMVEKTLRHAEEKREQVSLTFRSAYDGMGYDRKLYPVYDEKNYRLVNLTDSFNEFLFTEIYYDIIEKWTGHREVGDTILPAWTYTGSEEDQAELKELLCSTYKACYENTNTIFESVEHTKEYHLPSVTNQKGGKYYQIHEASWVKAAKEAGEARVRELEGEFTSESGNKLFIPPFQYEDTIEDEDKRIEEELKAGAREQRDFFIEMFCGASREKDDNGVPTGKYEKSTNCLVTYCYQKEQDWLATNTNTQTQSSEYKKSLLEARRKWIEDYAEDTPGISVTDFGSTWYCSYILEYFYPHWAYEKDIGTYTYNTDTFELNTEGRVLDSETSVFVNQRVIIQRRDVNGQPLFITNSNGEVVKDMVDLTVKGEDGSFTYYYPLYGIREVIDENQKPVKEVFYTPITSLNSYTFDYGNKVIDGVNTRVINYYSIDEGVCFATETVESAPGELDYYKPIQEDLTNSKINWQATTAFTTPNSATHFAKVDKWKTDKDGNLVLVDGQKVLKTEQEKTGSYVFDKVTDQIRLFDPYKDVLNATFIPEKSDEGMYVFDPFTWNYRPYRDWDSDEYRDPLTLEIDNNAGVPGDKVHHPLKLFDGHLGAWYDVPTRYNMVRKYEDPEAETKYKYLTEDITIVESGHYDGKTYTYQITYPKGYQTDVYEKASKGKYVKESDVPEKKRLFEVIFNVNLGTIFSFEGNNFSKFFEEAVDTVKDVAQQFCQAIKDFFNFGSKTRNTTQNPLQELITALNVNEGDNEDVNKNGAGIAMSNANPNENLSQIQTLSDEEVVPYDEDRVSITVYYKKDGDRQYDELAAVSIDMIANTSEITEGIRAKRIEEYIVEVDEGLDVTESGQAKTRTTAASEANDRPPETQTQASMERERYIKYKPYYWRHWKLQRYDYQPKICIQQVVDGITVYKPYNNIEDKKPEAYDIVAIERDDAGNPTNIPSDVAPDEIVFLKDRKTTYRQRVETDYEGFKYKMAKVDGMNKSYWIEAPNGEDYLRHYQFGDGTTKLFDGHLGRWVQCYTAEKDSSTATSISDSNYLPKFYLPYNDIMVPYSKRIFGATKQFTRMRTNYDSQNKDKLYVLHDNVYVTLEQYLNEIGYNFSLDYSGLKVSFIDEYAYNGERFSISLPEKPREKYLEFDLGLGPKSNTNPDGFQYIDLVVKKNTLTSEMVKERWAYWIAPVKKGFSLIENPLSKIGMIFETTSTSSDREQVKSNNIGRYAFLGMQLFKHIPYTKALKEITSYNVILPSVPQGEHEDNVAYQDRLEKENEVIEILNNALAEIYQSDSYSILDFINKLVINPDSITLLNGSSVLCDKNITVMIDVDNSGNNILKATKITSEKSITIPLFPGQAPDAEDLHFTNYYIYDPDAVDHPDNAIFEYVGQDYSDKFVPAYDETCQKIRSIKGKESNYFKLLQDCCSTFDCWMQKEVEHDPTTGQVKYRNIPVYTELIDPMSGTTNIEPQIYVGDEAKIEGTRIAAQRIHHKLYKKIVKVGTESDYEFQEYCYYEVAEGKILDEKEQRLLLRLNRINNLRFRLDYMRVPDKQIIFKQFVGEEKWNGFKYGVNLKHIKRTIDSSQFSTRVIVKPNSNEFGKDKFCTIARAEENPIKENFILDFSYYINNHLLDNSDLIGDLYTDVNTRINYYPKLASLNRERDEIIVKQSSLAVGLDNVTAKYETAVQLRDAALDEITKLTYILTSNYDTYGQVISVPWKYGKSQEYTQKRQTSAPGTTKMITDSYGGVDYTFEIIIPTTTTVAEYPKYNETMRSYLDQMDTYQKEYANSVKLLEELEPEKKRLEAELAEIEAYLEEIANKKNELNKLFYHKYSRYIQEGSWIDENYIDDNLYYLDALSVSKTSAKPKVTYDIGVVDISAAYEYEEDRLLLESEIGNRTYIEDTEFFGYRKDDHTKPYWELVIVTEKTYNLTDPTQNQVKVRNYTTQFEDIFQTITATSQTLQLNEGSYGRTSQIMNENGTLKAEAIQETITNADFVIMNSTNEDVKVDKTGITITSANNRANVVKLVSSGILVSSDGGNNYTTAITGDGINAELLLAGTLNTDRLMIGGRSNPNFMWNKLGISSFGTDGNKIDYSSFVRMDQYGIYGIKNYSKDGLEPENMSINDSFAPTKLKDIVNNPNAVFGLTWDGFFLNAANGSGKVTIGTGQDFRMSEFSDDQNRWIDRVVIGRLNNNDYYGFQLRNSKGSVVMETGDTGELYLKRKLRISNFGEQDTIEPYGWVHNGSEEKKIKVNIEVQVQRKDKEGNLLFKFDENGQKVPDMVESTRKEVIGDKEEIIYFYPQYTIQKNDQGQSEVVYQEITEFRSYFYRYETKIENGQEIHLKNYYSVQDGIQFATEVTTDTWQKGIKEQLDRVTLGIVDIYDRKRDYQKVDVDGVYNSTNYLTKVFSIKSNALLPLEQFTPNSIRQLIDKNENLAIFDNGNLFARNAWIEGEINATKGSITGELEVSGALKHAQSAGGKWQINSDGSASFKDIIISGKIQTSTFEYNNIQTVAGSLMVVSGITIQKIDFSEDEKTVILQLDTLSIPKELITDNGVKQETKIILAKDHSISYNTDKTMSNGFILTTSKIYIGTSSNVCVEIDLGKNKKTKEEVDNCKMIVFMETSEDDEKISIVINASSENGVFPKKSISILDICDINQPPRALFGFIDQVFFNNQENKDSIDNTIMSSISGDYGLYCDNVYIKGSLINCTDTYVVGITTEDILEKISPLGEKEYVTIFAGPAIDVLNFYVTKEGNLYSNNGYFTNGTFSGTIQTSKIIGNGDNSEYALDILGGKTNQKGLRFAGSEQDNAMEYLALTTSGCFFYGNSDQNTQLFSIIPKKEKETSNSVGMFYSKEEGVSHTKKDISGYKLNFQENEDEIIMSYKATEVAIISQEGLQILNNNKLGDFCECVAVVNKTQQKIGVDFILG